MFRLQEHSVPKQIESSGPSGHKYEVTQDFTSTKTFLTAELERRLQANPRYSLRAFARDLKMSPGELSELINGKRRATPKAIAKIAQRLGLNHGETLQLLSVHQVDHAGLESAIPQTHLNLDVFRLISDWPCLTILTLAETKGFRFDSRWIGGRLGISATEAKLALDRLERVGLIQRINGQLQVDSSFVLSPDGVPSEAIRNYHRQMLEKALVSLENDSVSDRDITGISLAMDPADLPAVREEIRKFQDKLVAKYTRGRKTEILHLQTALFRLTEGT